ncbi:MAG: hypothetical protein FGM55_12005, partial [Rhodoferax sp.]|nr:hypothetical protein [Rhodoferax sp.]
MYLRSIFELYGATGINFLLLIFRDWYLLAHVEAHREFLSMIYAASVAGAFSVNAVLLGQVFHRRNSWFIALLAVSTLLFLVIAARSDSLSYEGILIGSVVPALWAIGARITRTSFGSGIYFLGRVREGAANLLLILLVTMNFSLVAIPASILLSNALLYGVNKYGAARRIEVDKN